MNIIFIHLGKKIPKHLIYNTQDLRRKFPHAKIIVANNVKRNRDKFLKDEIDFRFIIEPGVRNLNSDDQTKNKFRRAFWFKSKVRLIILCEIILSENLTDVFHIENDIWISKEFPFHKIINSGKKIAFPMTNHHSGIASSLYIKDKKSAKLLLDEFTLSFSNYPFLTDVDLLGKFANTHRGDVYFQLPSGLNQRMTFQNDINFNTFERMTENINLFNGIFDGSTFGIYLTGSDPRNHFGKRKLYFDLEGHSVIPSKLEYQYINGRVFANYNGSSTEIFSLHIHSKDLRIFRKVRCFRKNTLEKRIKQSGNGAKSEFVFLGLLNFLRDYFELLPNYLRRKVFRNGLR